MKTLRPSMRENKRYLLIRGRDLSRNVEKAILDFAGVLGMSKTGLVWIKTDEKKDTAVIGVNREALDLVRASLAIWPEKITVKKVSGTIKKLIENSKSNKI